MSSLDQALQAITDSVNTTLDSVERLHQRTDSPELPPLVEDLLQKTSQSLPEGVSLLDLKNNVMLSYLNNVLLVALARIETVKSNQADKINETKNDSLKRSIVQRVVMERGIKNLEKKLQYQLEKMIRNYSKMENDSSEKSVTKKLEDQESDNDNGKDSEGNEESEEEDSEDELNFRPDTAALINNMKKTSKKGSSKSEGETAPSKDDKYRPPKISATLPPSQLKDSSGRPKRNGKKLQAMEEYLQETGEAPMTEQSIGSNILNNGRGGIQTAQDRRKEQEIKSFEESNFTRLSTTLSKKDKRNKKRQDQETFFGEDWGIFNSRDSNSDMNTKRKRPNSAWDRAKRRKA